MFLKSLTIRGFKSFADKTNLAFEPGVSVVVGPNGSGKSNICDSISWVLGEQGPRSLRGSKMEDVIFAGSPMRPALGMAEVTLKIDNSSGLLPIEFSEVTVSRTLLRSGESEYRLNGQECRLLDIQELLSDTGVGREQHTIIGQGQLDDILTADADQMRGFIEEAAGVSKHRRRKERALRKLTSSEQNLARLSDMLREVRRTLKPLREQAEMARRHSEAAAELSRVRLVLMARELAILRGRLGGDLEDLDATIRSKEERLKDLEDRLREAEAAHSRGFTQSETAREAAWRLARQAERLESLERFAGERGRALEAELAATTEEAARARVTQLATEVDLALQRLTLATEEHSVSDSEEEVERGRLQEISEARAGAEETEASARGEMRRLADEEVRLRGEIAALQASIDAAWQEEGRAKRREDRLSEALGSAREAAEQAAAEVAALEDSEGPHVEAVERATSEIEDAARRLDELQEDLRRREREAAYLEALAGRSSPDAARRATTVPGVIGVLSDLVHDTSDRELLRGVVGDPSGVVVASSAEAAAAALGAAGGDPLVVLMGGAEAPHVGGGRALAEALTSAGPEVLSALSSFFLVADLSEGLDLAQRHHDAVFVVEGGPVIFRGMVTSGYRDAAARAAEAKLKVERIITERSRASEKLREARDRRDEEINTLNRLDAQIAAAAERLSGAEREAHGLERESVAISEARATSERSASSLQRRLADLEAVLPQLSKQVRDAEAALEKARADSARALGEREIAAKALEEARLRSARTYERVRLVEEQQTESHRALEAARAATGEVEDARERLRAAIVKTSDVAAAAAVLKTEAGAWADEAEAAYRRLREMLEGLGEEVNRLRSQRASVASDLDETRTKAREEDLGLSEARIRSKIIEEKIREEGADPEEMIERFGERLEVEDPSRIEDPLVRLAVNDDAALKRREGRLQSDLSRLGAVNPLAEQEFDALGDRERFLEEQIADVRKSRRDLFRLVSQIDVRIREMFMQAFRDIADEYERLFALLFPGGMGRLRLTDPNDPLETGIEVEARPGGKNLRRLSLLSGGEKALSALAFLFAIFRARPSPFYVLDEVEAALDDVNLHRFLTLIKEFRSTSQLIVVTHQKRTMEAADVLYGVSISPEGASRVISQRLSDEPVGIEELAAPSAEEASTEPS